MKAPVSMCMIVRNDPHLESCIKSFIDYVEELCIVITSDKDLDSIEIAKKYNAKYEVFTNCNDGYDRIQDFSMARNRSIDLATQPWFCWVDSDDIISGVENLATIINDFTNQKNDCEGAMILLPYEYSYANNGESTCTHYRERLFYNPKLFHFIQPVHEVAVPCGTGKIIQVKNDKVLFKHQRQFTNKPQEPGRNLRILEKYFADGGTDVRNKYYIGLEYSNHGRIEEACKYLTDYVATSGWDDEKAMAYMKLVDLSKAKGQYQQGLNYAFELLKMKHNWFESYYHICKMYYHLNDFVKSSYYGRLALLQPPTETLLFVNIVERYDIHTYLNVAFNNIGDVAAALQSCQAGLVGLPNEPHLLNNLAVYQKHMFSQNPVEVLQADQGKLSIAFVTAPGLENWSPETVKVNGIGGSEMMLINQAKNLAALGHKVVVYAMADGIFDQVEYRNVNRFSNLTCDVLVVSRYANFLSDDYKVNAKLKLLWLHDVMAHGATSELLLKADRILALSQWHKDNIVKVHQVHPDHVLVTRNGIDLDRFNKKTDKKKYQCINSSSPDRSWPILLNCWSNIVEQVPEATLELFYGFDNWKKIAQHDKLHMDLIVKLEEQIKSMPSIHFHGRVNQEELAQHFLESKVYLFPTWFTETSCIGMMECQAADMWIVSTNLAAIPETCAGYQKAILIDGDWTSPEYQQKFIDATVKILKEENV